MYIKIYADMHKQCLWQCWCLESCLKSILAWMPLLMPGFCFWINQLPLWWQGVSHLLTYVVSSLGASTKSDTSFQNRKSLSQFFNFCFQDHFELQDESICPFVTINGSSLPRTSLDSFLSRNCSALPAPASS